MTRRNGRMAAVVVIALAAASVAKAATTYTECVLEKVFPSGDDAALTVAVEDGRIVEHALALVRRPHATCAMAEVGLTVADNRLKGPLRIRADSMTERLQLDVDLAAGGTYLRAQGCPDGARETQGAVNIETPADAKSKRWTIWLPDAMGPGIRLGLVFTIDRAAKTLTAQHGWASGYNQGQHRIDASKLTFDGTNVVGEMGIVIVPDGSRPAHGRHTDGRIQLKLSLDGKDDAGRYTALFGIESQVAGRVTVKPSSREQLRDLAAPVIPLHAPWRTFLALATPIFRAGEALECRSALGKGIAFDPARPPADPFRHSPVPPADWTRADFDDSPWPRFQAELSEFLGASHAQSGSLPPALLCLRTCFGVTDPERATDLTLKLVYTGGAVVYVNGQEVGRDRMPDGDLTPWTPAKDYPTDAYATEDAATPLPPLTRGAEPEAKWAARYALRTRTAAIPIPTRALVKGRNVLAIALRRAAIAGPVTGDGWSHVGFNQALLSSVSGAGLVPYADALRGTRVWSAAPFEQIAESPSLRSVIAPQGGVGRTSQVKGVQFGNPFDPLRPIRLLAPRNGVGSGQTVVSNPDGLRQVSATVAEFKGPGGATIPASAVQVRYAVQNALAPFCDALMEKPPEGARTVPVWVIAQAPRDAAPGWYASALEIEADGRRFSVPLRLLVSPVTVPDGRDFTSSISLAESPESVALQYGVKCWSDEHLKLWEKSVAMMGQVGNDVFHVPVILGPFASYPKSWAPRSDVTRPGPRRRVPLVRWVRKDGKLVADYGLLEKVLDVYLKHCAPPQALSFYVWELGCARKMGDAYEGRRIPSRSWTPPSKMMVSVWDPATDTTTDTEVPTWDDPGAEAFWKPLVEGLRELVKRRGWSERVILASLGGDIRPAEETGALVRQWAPYMRWNFLSHFSGDPVPTAEGKMIATGGCEVGLKEYPGGDWLSLPQLESRILNPPDFLDLPTYREVHTHMPAFAFRMLPMQWGAMTRIALDFWPGKGGPGNGSWFSHTEHMSAPGPDGAVPTIRFQMLREGAQEHEIRAALVRAYDKLPAERREPYRTLMEEFMRRAAFGAAYLPLMEMSFDWPAYAARLHAAAAELAGEKMEAEW